MRRESDAVVHNRKGQPRARRRKTCETVPLQFRRDSSVIVPSNNFYARRYLGRAEKFKCLREDHGRVI